MKEAKKTLETRINFCALPEDYSDAQPTDESHELPEDFLGHEETVKKRSKRTCIRSDEEYDDDPLLDIEAKLKKETMNVATEDQKQRQKAERDKQEGNVVSDEGEGELKKETMTVETEDFDEEFDGRANPRRKYGKTYNMDAKNLDFNVTFVKTQMARDQLMHESYTYNLTDNQQSSSQVVRWKCSLSQKRGCRGKVVTALDNSCVLIDTKTDHNHPPKTEARVLLIKFKEEIRQIVRNHPDMETSEILASARMQLKTDIPLGPKVNSITRQIQRWRQEQKQGQKADRDKQEGNAMSDEGEGELKKETMNVATEDFDEEFDGRTNPRRKYGKTYNMDAVNLDFNVTFVKTLKLRDQLMHESYTYNLTDNQQSSGEVARWRCSLYQRRGCRSKVVTALDNSCVLIDTKTDHNHPPKTEDKVLLIKFKEEIRRIVCNHPDMKPSEILASARMLLDTDLPLGLKVSSITRLIQRWRQEQKQKAEKHRQDGNDVSDEDEAEMPEVSVSS